MAFVDPGSNVGAPPGPPPGPPVQAPRPPGMPPAFAAFLQGQGGPQVSAPGPGNQADFMSRMHLIVEMLQQALPLAGIGTPLHDRALRATQQLSQMISKSGGAPLGQLQTLWRDLGNQIGRTGLLQQLMANNQVTGGGGGPPGGQQGPPGPPPMPGGAFPGA